MEEQYIEEGQAYDGNDSFNRIETSNVNDPTIAHLQIIADEVVHDYKKELLGFYTDKDGNEIIIDEDPLCNQNGANKLVSFVRASVSKVVTLGNLEKKQLSNMLLALANSLVIQIGANYEEYGIDYRRLKQVKELTLTYIESNLSRALRGFTAKMIARNTTIQENRQMQEKKRGMFGFGGSQ